MNKKKSPDSMNFFCHTYQESRQHFRDALTRIRQRWPAASLEARHVAEGSGDDDLTIDWIAAPPLRGREKLLILTTGQHGIEGYVGSAMLQLFFEEYLPHLSPDDTGLLFVHAINPWGMKYQRKTNSNNVDLNRNFCWPEDFFTTIAPTLNANYKKVAPLISPQQPLANPAWEATTLILGALGSAISLGVNGFIEAALAGQYQNPKGFFYGGDSLQEETLILMELYRQYLPEFEQTLLLDMHSGYGRRYQMSLVCSPLEPRSVKELAVDFAYPLVVKSSSPSFYTMHGDMIDFVYTLVKQACPAKRFFGACFEFGTFGDSLPARLRSLRAMVFENQVHWYGARNADIRHWVESEFRELYYPTATQWRLKAIADARTAFRGILNQQGYLSIK